MGKMIWANWLCLIIVPVGIYFGIINIMAGRNIEIQIIAISLMFLALINSIILFIKWMKK